MVETKRKGAARVADVPPDILAQLNAGEIESATLSESLAIDFATLLRSVLPDLSNKADRIDPKDGITKRMSKVAEIIFQADGLSRLSWLASHPSDLVRGWGAYLLALDDQRNLPEQLEAMRPFADDPHFGVREWAWLALRPAVCADPEAAISAVTPWTAGASENIRRFACEAIRPRGVWASHIKVLKSEPHRGLPVLEPLRSDPSRYVQDSVANWLNDAWKSQPDWVEGLCARWSAESDATETGYIVKRALRNRKKS